VQRIQRGRDEVRVFLRYPQEQRQNLATLDQMRLRNAAGVEIPLSRVAELDVGRSFSSISRVDRSRAINIRADADNGAVDVGAIKTELTFWHHYHSVSRADQLLDLGGHENSLRAPLAVSEMAI